MSQGYRTSPSFREQYPLPKQSAINALLPDYGRILTGENVAFVGAAALCLVGLGLVARRIDLLWVRAWVLVAAGLAFVMALGTGTGLTATCTTPWAWSARSGCRRGIC